MSIYSKLLTKAAEVYYAARSGDEKAMAIESVAFGLHDQFETFNVLSYEDLDDDAKTSPIADNMADALGFTLAELSQ